MQSTLLFQILSILPATTRLRNVLFASLSWSLLGLEIFLWFVWPPTGYALINVSIGFILALHCIILVEGLLKREQRKTMAVKLSRKIILLVCLVTAGDGTACVLGGQGWWFLSYSVIAIKLTLITVVGTIKHLAAEFKAMSKDKNLEKLRLKCLELTEHAEVIDKSFSYSLLGAHFLIFIQLILDLYNLFLALVASTDVLGERAFFNLSTLCSTTKNKI